MRDWKSMDEILDFAIGEEEGAARFYQGLAESIQRPNLRQLFLDFAQEEMGHKAKLIEVKAGQSTLSSKDNVEDLKVCDYLVEVEPHSSMNYQQALVVAMKKEKAAFKLYTDLASVVQDKELRQTFLALAQEEAKHKLRFELEYDQSILSEN
jgi:rubrerythrin